MWDDRYADERWAEKCKVGFVVILCNDELLIMVVHNLSLACVGTCNIIQKYDKSYLELNTKVGKYINTRRTYSDIHQFSSRKTVAAQRILMMHLIKRMKAAGLEDPFTADVHKRFTLSTDLETSYIVALANAFVYHYESQTSLRYAQCVASGRDVHTMSKIQNKVEVLKEPNLYSWALGTRRVLYETTAC